MNRQSTALLFVFCLLAVFEMVYSEDNVKPTIPTTTTEKGVATYSALGAIVTAVLANFF